MRRTHKRGSERRHRTRGQDSRKADGRTNFTSDFRKLDPLPPGQSYKGMEGLRRKFEARQY